MNIHKIISLSFLVSFVSPLGLIFRFFDDMSITVEGYLSIALANYVIYWFAYFLARVYSRSREVEISSILFILVVMFSTTVLWFALMSGHYIPKGGVWVAEFLFKLAVGPAIIFVLMYPWAARERLVSTLKCDKNN